MGRKHLVIRMCMRALREALVGIGVMQDILNRGNPCIRVQIVTHADPTVTHCFRQAAALAYDDWNLA